MFKIKIPLAVFMVCKRQTASYTTAIIVTGK